MPKNSCISLGLMGFVSEENKFHSNQAGLYYIGKSLRFFFPSPFSIESRKEKKADSGKGVDRETCL